MNSKKNRFVSVLLSFVMMISLVLEVFPPVTVHSAAAQSNLLKINELNGKDIDEVVVNKQDLTLTWSKLEDATAYRLRIRSNEEGVSAIDIKNYTKMQYTIPESWLTPGIEYEVFLYRYKDGKTVTAGRLKFSFLVAGGESILNETFEITSPKWGGQGFPYDNINVSWDRLQYATSYKLLLEYFCGAGGSARHEVLLAELDSTTSSYVIPVRLLREGTEYQLTLFAYDKHGNELHDKLQFITEGDVARQELSEPVITSPYFTDQYELYSNIKTIPVYDDVIVTWNEIPTAVRYSVSLKMDRGAEVSLPGAEQITDAQYKIPVERLTSGAVYEVVVTAYHEGSNDCSAQSEKYYFRAPYRGNLVLDAPLLISHDFSTNRDEPTQFVIQKMNLEWGDVSAAKKYRVNLVSLEDSDYKLTYKNLTDNKLSVPYKDIYETFSKGEVIEIEIDVDDAWGNFSTISYYIELTERPVDKPVILSPALASAETAMLPAFEAEEDLQVSWGAVNTAASYRIYLLEYYNGEWEELLRWDNITDTTFTIPGKYLYDCGKFKIKIAAYNSYGKSSGASGYYFCIGSANRISLTAPSAEITSWQPSYDSTYKYFNVNTVDAWTAVVSDSWIQLNKRQGDGTSSVKIDVTENRNSLPRTGTVTFTTKSGESVVLTIAQAANGLENEGNLVISNPGQGDSIEKEAFRARWNYKFGYAYFSLELKNLATNTIAHSENNIITSYADIPANVLNGDTNYLLTVYVYTPSKECVKQASVIFTVLKSDEMEDVRKPVIDPISCSAASIMYGSSVTFSTKVSDAIALDNVVMYIDDTIVRNVSASGTAAKISYTTDSLTVGKHTVSVKVYDRAGNSNSLSKEFTVKKTSAGSIYDVELSDYDFYAGNTITFTVTTSTDTTKIRLLDGAYAFSEQSSGYTDSGRKRIWKFEQHVGTVGNNRTLKVETYSGGWTGNTCATDPFTVRKNEVNLGNFAVLSPETGSKHQINTSLTVRWSQPDVKPDRYVVNVTGVPSDSGLISVNGTAAIISGSVFDEYGTYTISITAQKKGCDQTEAHINIIVDCLHGDTQRINNVNGIEYYHNESQHIVTIVPQYMCNICGGTFEIPDKAYSEYRAHDKDIKLDNGGWYCDCGYANVGSYKAWEGELLSEKNQSVYRNAAVDGTLSKKHGTVFVTDDILVCGTKYGALFIRYPITGGYKYGFISSGLIQDINYQNDETLTREEIYKMTLTPEQYHLWNKLNTYSSPRIVENESHANFLLFEDWAQSYEDSMFEQIKNDLQSLLHAAKSVVDAITLDIKGAADSFSEIDSVGKRKTLYKAAIKNHITQDIPTSISGLLQEQLSQFPVDSAGNIIKGSLDLGEGIYGIFKEYTLNDTAIDNIIKICESMDFKKFNTKSKDLYERLRNYSVTIDGKTFRITDYFNVSEESAAVVRASMKNIKDSKNPVEAVKQAKEIQIIKKASDIGSLCGTFIASMDTLIEIVAINSALDIYQKEFAQYADLDISDAMFEECVAEVIKEYKINCIQTLMTKELIIFADYLYKLADIDGKIIGFISSKIPGVGTVISTTKILQASMSVINTARELLFNTNAIRNGLNSLPELRNSVSQARTACVTSICSYAANPSQEAFYKIVKEIEYYELIGTLGTEVLMQIEKNNYDSLWNVLQRKGDELAEKDVMFKLNPWYHVLKALSDTGLDEDARNDLWNKEMEKLSYFRRYIYN